MKNFTKTFLVAILLISIFSVNIAFAGFGVTPPYFRNSSLTRNSTYEQQILLVRGDPTVDLKATVILDAPEIEDWITIVEGNEFLLPRGERKVPMTVRVKVPEKVDFKTYKGAILVKTGAPDDQVSSGAVNISLGVQIDIELNVIDKEIKDFRIRKLNMKDLNEGHKFGWLYFPGKIRFGMLLENTGNVDVAPSRVVFRIYDRTGKVLLEETESKGRIKKIAPYATEEVFAELPTRLPSGSYLGRYEIFNGDEIKNEGEVNVSIRPFGSVNAAGFGFSGLSTPHKISVLLPILATIALILFLVYTVRTKRSRRVRQ